MHVSHPKYWKKSSKVKVGLWLTSSPEISRKKSVEVRCITTQKTATTESALPNNVNSFQNYFLKIKYSQSQTYSILLSKNPFLVLFRISLEFGVWYPCGWRVDTTQIKKSQQKGIIKTIYGSNISPIYYLNILSKFIKSVDLISFHTIFT